MDEYGLSSMRSGRIRRSQYAIYEPVEFEDGVSWVETGSAMHLEAAKRFTKKIKNVIVMDTRLDTMVIVKKEN